MNYLALADWIERIAIREQLGPPWGSGSEKGIGAILDLDERPLNRAIFQAMRNCDWLTRSSFITPILNYLREFGYRTIDIEEPIIEEVVTAEQLVSQAAASS